MRRQVTLMAAVWLALAAPALAEAPETSLRPEPNPRMVTKVATSGLPVTSTLAIVARLRPMTRPDGLAVPEAAPSANPAVVQPAVAAAGGPSLGGVGIAALRPAARPNVPRPDAAVVRVAATARSLPLAASAIPMARPPNVSEPEDIQEVVFRTQPPAVATIGKKGSVCGDPAIRGQTIPPIAAKMKGCGLEDGVKVTSVDGIPLSTPATMDCVTAEALKTWVSDALKPAVGKKGGGVARIEVAASYACRPRNNQRGAKVSEHGRGRAIDISGIMLANGEVISVLKHWGEGKAGKILQKVRAAACGPFGTVLGPGSDRFHRDHFHFDTARYRSGAYCR